MTRGTRAVAGFPHSAQSSSLLEDVYKKDWGGFVPPADFLNSSKDPFKVDSKACDLAYIFVILQEELSTLFWPNLLSLALERGVLADKGILLHSVFRNYMSKHKHKFSFLSISFVLCFLMTEGFLHV